MKTWQCWTLAVVVTIGSAVWQRTTGPTYPARGRVDLDGQGVAMRLLRTQITGKELPVVVTVADPEVAAEVVWRRYPTGEEWRSIFMHREGSELLASLPTQAAAGKIEYQVRLRRGNATAAFPTRPAVARFRGDVPAWVLIPHILAMFTGMLLATRAGLEALARRGNVRRLSWWALGLLVVGGFILGPAVQKYAFDAWWTGVPFGWDLTDNKTLIAVAAWVVAMVAMRGGRPARIPVLAAAVVTMVVFAIPHSVWGSEIDWKGVAAREIDPRLQQ